MNARGGNTTTKWRLKIFHPFNYFRRTRFAIIIIFFCEKFHFHQHTTLLRQNFAIKSEQNFFFVFFFWKAHGALMFLLFLHFLGLFFFFLIHVINHSGNIKIRITRNDICKPLREFHSTTKFDTSWGAHFCKQTNRSTNTKF